MKRTIRRRKNELISTNLLLVVQPTSYKCGSEFSFFFCYISAVKCVLAYLDLALITSFAHTGSVRLKTPCLRKQRRRVKCLRVSTSMKTEIMRGGKYTHLSKLRMVETLHQKEM